MAEEADSGRRIVLARGDTLRVSLEENPSTGYAWRTVRRPAREVLRRQDDRFVEPEESDPPVVGAPGRREITWRAVGRGRTRMTLRLFPPGEGRPAERSFRLAVVVRGRTTGAPAMSAASARCAELKGRDVLGRGLIKVVDRRYTMADGRRGHAYVACPKGDPGARQRRIKASRRGGKLSFLDTRGAILAVRDRASGAVTLHDAVLGTRRRLRSGGRDPVGRVLVGEAGEAAAVFGSGDASSLVGFDYDGTRYVLGTGDIERGAVRAERVQHRRQLR